MSNEQPRQKRPRRTKSRRQGCRVPNWTPAEDRVLAALVRDGYSERQIIARLRKLHPLVRNGADPKARRSWAAIRTRIDNRFSAELEQSSQGFCTLQDLARETKYDAAVILKILRAAGVEISRWLPAREWVFSTRADNLQRRKKIAKDEAIEAIAQHAVMESQRPVGPTEYARMRMVGTVDPSQDRCRYIAVRAATDAGAARSRSPKNGIETFLLKECEWAAIVTDYLSRNPLRPAQRRQRRMPASQATQRRPRAA